MVLRCIGLFNGVLFTTGGLAWLCIGFDANTASDPHWLGYGALGAVFMLLGLHSLVKYLGRPT